MKRPIMQILLFAFLIIVVVYFGLTSYYSGANESNSLILKSNSFGMGNTVSSESNCEDLSILTWNIWFGSRQGWDEPDTRWTELLNIALDKLPDIIGFQECTQAFIKLVDSHSSFKEQYHAVSEVQTDSSYFVMVFSRKGLPILKSSTILLKTTLGRKCQYIDIKKNGSVFRFGTVHIESYVTSPNIREIQMQTIFKVFEKQTSAELSFLVGDFNFHETDKENKFIEESNFTDTWPVVNKDDKGLTFETQTNLMAKHSVLIGEAITSPVLQRLDRILYWQRKSSKRWAPGGCELLGTLSFKDVLLNDGTKVPLFPSDHFGLFSKFKKCEI